MTMTLLDKIGLAAVAFFIARFVWRATRYDRQARRHKCDKLPDQGATARSQQIDRLSRQREFLEPMLNGRINRRREIAGDEETFI